MHYIFYQLIFPMTKTSDDIDYLQHNLWIIDEKLAYHHYLASDMKIKKMEEVENNLYHLKFLSLENKLVNIFFIRIFLLFLIFISYILRKNI